MSYTEGKSFDKVDYKVKALSKGEYENCIFNGCDFSDSDLVDIKFVDCRFVDCNLSLSNLASAALRGVVFKESKMLGVHFEKCNELGLSISFDSCNLSHSSFYRTKLRKTSFRKSLLAEADFAECDLTGSQFDNCDLAGAMFDKTILEKVDFRTSFNFSIDPSMNRVRKARFSLSGVAGLLEKFDIEIDGTN